MNPNEEEKSHQTSAEPYDADLEKRFSLHPADNDQLVKMARVRALVKSAAYAIKGLTPYSCEQPLVLTHLEEAVFWANAAIARNE